MATNDNDLDGRSDPPLPRPDPHGQAALLLVESLIHGLLARSVISIGDAVDIVETAESVQIEAAESAEHEAAPLWRSQALLSAIMQSLKIDDRSAPDTVEPAP